MTAEDEIHNSNKLSQNQQNADFLPSQFVLHSSHPIPQTPHRTRNTHTTVVTTHTFISRSLVSVSTSSPRAPSHTPLLRPNPLITRQYAPPEWNPETPSLMKSPRTAKTLSRLISSYVSLSVSIHACTTQPILISPHPIS